MTSEPGTLPSGEHNLLGMMTVFAYHADGTVTSHEETPEAWYARHPPPPSANVRPEFSVTYQYDGWGLRGDVAMRG